MATNKVLSLIKLNTLLALVYGVFTALYDAWQLITPDALIIRWVIFLTFLVVLVALWYVAKYNKSQKKLPFIIGALILANLIFISLSIFFERGMASRAVMMYSLPILSAAFFNNKRTVYFVALLSVFSYTLSAKWYSVVHPSEGYKIEIYGTILFYSIFMFLIAGFVALLSDKGKT